MRLIIAIALLTVALPTLALSQTTKTPKQSKHRAVAAKVTSGVQGSGLVLQVEQGERRVRRYLSGLPFIIKVDRLNGGSNDMMMAMEDVPPGGAIPMHKHLHGDEILFIHRGEGVVSLNDHETPVRAGSTVFIPRGVWVTFKNTASEPLSVIFIFSKPGFEQYLRAGSVPEGEKVIPLSPEELRAIRRRNEWHTIFKNP